jgi:putative tricarboxylic transport membrane protein
MKHRDLWGSLFWLIASIFVCIEAIKMGVGSFRAPGPGFLPFWSGLFVGCLAIVLLARSLRKEKEGKGIGHLWQGMMWGKVVLVAVSLFIYGIILPRLGFLVTTFGLMTLLFSSGARSRVWVPAASAGVAVVASYIAFSYWLGVPLPKGIFGF